MSTAIPEDGFAVAVQAEIRRAFKQGEAMRTLVLVTPPAPPPGARLGALVIAAANRPDWRANCAEVTAAVNARLDKAETLLKSYAAEVDILAKVADHLSEGDPLPDGLSADLALACRMVAGTEESLSAARGIQAEQGPARRRIDVLKGELTRARSAAAVATSNWSRTYTKDLGLDPDALGLTQAWRSAVEAHTALLTQYRAKGAAA